MKKPNQKPLAAMLLLALSMSANATGGLSSGGVFTQLGFFPGVDPSLLNYDAFSTATGVSADGSIVVGTSTYQTGYQPFFIVGIGGMQPLSAGSSDNSYASAVSGDGSTIVGSTNVTASLGAATFPWRWTAATGYTNLGHLDSPYGYSSVGYANGVSNDGSVVVGASALQAFRWTATTGMVGLGFLPGYSMSSASAVSADGSIVVGGATKSDNTTSMAFRWTQATGMTSLGHSPDGGGSYAFGISANGNVIVGGTITNSGGQAFRWTQSGGMVGLGVEPGYASSFATAVSADGSVVVGTNRPYFSPPGPNEQPPSGDAFRWTAATGMQSVATWLANAGVKIPSNFYLSSANATNASGNVLVGNGVASYAQYSVEEAWIARVGPDGGGLITDTGAYEAGLAEANSHAVQGVADLADLTLFGAHHRSLFDDGQVRSDNGACAWATGDAAQFNQLSMSTHLFEVGACKDLGSSTRIGVGVGKAFADQDLSLGGNGRYNGHYEIVEVDQKFGNDFEGSVLGYQGNFDVDLLRHYLNGADVDASSANSDGAATAVRARLDWLNAAQIGQLSLSPYAIYNWTRATLDGYTEAGGSFPASFNPSRLITNEARLGAEDKWPMSSSVDLRVALEGVHRFNGETNNVDGEVVDLFSFSLPGQKLKQNWARALVDVDYRVTTASIIVLSANGATPGGDASWGVSARYQMAF